MWKNCALLAKILKMCRKMHICEEKGSGYGATEKNNFWRVMTFFVEVIFNVRTCLIFFALSRLYSIGCNYCGL